MRLVGRKTKPNTPVCAKSSSLKPTLNQSRLASSGRPAAWVSSGNSLKASTEPTQREGHTCGMSLGPCWICLSAERLCRQIELSPSRSNDSIPQMCRQLGPRLWIAVPRIRRGPSQWRVRYWNRCVSTFSKRPMSSTTTAQISASYISKPPNNSTLPRLNTLSRFSSKSWADARRWWRGWARFAIALAILMAEARSASNRLRGTPNLRSIWLALWLCSFWQPGRPGVKLQPNWSFQRKPAAPAKFRR